jgi:hypothetical protein
MYRGWPAALRLPPHVGGRGGDWLWLPPRGVQRTQELSAVQWIVKRCCELEAAVRREGGG